MYAQGHLVFLRGTTLMAQSFDVGRRELMGDATPLAEGIDVAGGVANPGAYSISASGVLASPALSAMCVRSSSGLIGAADNWPRSAKRQS